MNPTGHFEKPWTPLALCVLFVGIILRFYAINAPLVSDELATASLWAQMPYEKIPFNYQYPNNHIFHTALVSFILKTFGPYPVAIRIPVFIAGVGSLILIYITALKISGNRTTSLGALTLTTFAASPVYYSTSARGYALLMLFALATIWLLVSLMTIEKSSEQNSFKKASWPFCAGLLVLWVMGTWTVPTFVYFEGALVIWIGGWMFFSRENNYPALRRLLICLTLSIAAFCVQYFVLIDPEMLKAAMSRAAVMSSKNFFPKLINEWTQPWDSFYFIFVLFAFLGIRSISSRNPKVGSVLIALIILPALTGWLAGVLGLMQHIPDPRVFHYSIPFFYLAVSAGALWVLEGLNIFLIGNRGEKSRMLQSLIAIILISLVVLWGVRDFAFRVAPALQKREPYHKIRDFIKTLGPNDLILASNKHHVWFYLYGASAMRERVGAILDVGRLDAIYFMAAFKGKDSDAKRVKIKNQEFLQFEGFPSVVSTSKVPSDLVVLESLLSLEKQIGSFSFFKVKPAAIRQTARLAFTEDRRNWILPKDSSKKVQWSSVNPTLYFQSSFFMRTKQKDKMASHEPEFNLFLASASTHNSDWLIFSNGQEENKGISFDFSWRGNNLILDHPYGPAIFERPWKFWVFISREGSGKPALEIKSVVKRKTGMIRRLVAYSITPNEKKPTLTGELS